MSNYYVSKSGNDANAGTLASPFLTINHAAQVAVAGDTVNVLAGTYNERVFPANSGTIGNVITYQNYNGASVVIDGTGLSYDAIFLVQLTNYINISGFIVQNNTYSNIGSGIFLQGATNINITSCIIHDVTCSGIGCQTISSTQCANITVNNCVCYNTNSGSNQESISFDNVNTFEIKNCTVHDTGGQVAIDAKRGSTNGSIHNNTCYNAIEGIYLDSSGIAESNIAVYNNICYNNSSNGILLGAEANPTQQPLTSISVYNNICYGNVVGINVGSVSVPANTFSFIFINNTTYNNTYADICLGQYSYISSGVIRNNIMVTTTGQILMSMTGSGGNVVIDHNLFYDATNTYNTIYGTSYVKADPLFISPTTNFGIPSGSPAVGAGSATGQCSSTDIIGNTWGTPPCIGAYQYVVVTNNYPIYVWQRTV